MGTIRKLTQEELNELNKKVNNYDALEKENKVLRHKLAMSERREAVLCSDCRGKGYITKDVCILCEHERRIKKRLGYDALVEACEEMLRWYDAGKRTSRGYVMALTSSNAREQLFKALQKAKGEL